MFVGRNQYPLNFDISITWHVRRGFSSARKTIRHPPIMLIERMALIRARRASSCEFLTRLFRLDSRFTIGKHFKHGPKSLCKQHLFSRIKFSQSPGYICISANLACFFWCLSYSLSLSKSVYTEHCKQKANANSNCAATATYLLAFAPRFRTTPIPLYIIVGRHPERCWFRNSTLFLMRICLLCKAHSVSILTTTNISRRRISCGFADFVGNCFLELF